jgi:hypothetical protein
MLEELYLIKTKVLLVCLPREMYEHCGALAFKAEKEAVP